MAQLAIAAAGAAAGFAIGGPGGAQIGWAVGSMVGAQFGPKQKSYGPRLEDLKITGSEYGQTIPWIAGHPRLAGQVWWASDRREIATTTSQGKGGGGAESTSYSYEVDLLIGLTDTVIVDVSRIWLNGKLVYVTLTNSDQASMQNSIDNPNWSRLTVYTGAADQLPDPTYEAAVTNAPAYRGRGSVFIEGLQLGNSGVIPNLTFEIATGTEAANSTILLNGTFEERLVDNSCYDRGDAELTSTPPTGTFSSSGYTFLQDANASIPETKGFGWQTSDFAWHTSVETTFEILFSVGTGSPSATEGCYVFGIGQQLTIPSAVYAGFADPGDNRFHFFQSFAGISGYAACAANAVHHVAICIPATPSAGDPVRFYFNGAQLWTQNSKTILTSSIDAVLLGGMHGTTPVTSSHNVTYKGVRVTRGIVYPGGTAFTPPTTFDPPICVPATTIDNMTLQETVEALCERSMPAGTYDASGLSTITKPVRSFALSQIAPTRSAIEQLMAGYFFEAYLTDKLYFVPRAGSVTDTIEADDMGSGLDGPENETLPTQIGSDLEIPAQVSVSYSNVDADYTVATEYSDRLLSGQISTSVVQLPLGFTSEEGKGIADAIVIDGYASRVTGTFSVPIGYAELTPTSVVTVPDADGNAYRVRIVRRTDEGPLLKFEWVLDDATAIESAGITSDDYIPTIGIALPGDTIMELMDVPLMRDAENALGHYVAATSSGNTWPGASISRSLDDVEYAESARVNERATLGVTTTTLANFVGVGFDEINTVTVNLNYGTLSSSTRAGLLANASLNNIMIGSELIRFRAATMLNQGVYILSGLLRGQKGTEWAMSGHTLGDAVVLIQANGLRYVAIDLPSLSAARYYKGVTLGKSLASVVAESFTCQGVSLKPLAPVNLRSTVGTGNQITVTWDRRTRLACTFTGGAGVSVPLGELTEAYEVDVVLISGSVLKRTITATSASAVYTASMQTTDGISGSTPIRFDVYQMSAVVGRGYVASLTTAGSATPLPQITTLTVGGSFATGAALYATLGGVTYNYSSVGGDTNLDGIATNFAAVIDAAAAYTATAVGSVVTVTGVVSTPFPVVAGVSAGDNTTTWSLTQTASDTVVGVSNEMTFRWLNLSDPGGANAYPLGMTFSAIVQRIDPPLNLIYQYVTTPSGRTNYEVLPIAASAILTAFAASGDSAAYGLSMTLSDAGTSTLSLFTPASEPYNWTVQAIASDANVSGLVGNTGSGVTPATLRPQVVTLTLAGTPVTGNVYRTILGGVTLEYTATGGDTTMALVATGLAGVIDAHGDYLASAVGAVITITHASNNVPFTYSATVISNTVTLTAATTQEAA